MQFRASSIPERTRLPPSENTVLNNLGAVANDQGQYERASRRYEQSLAIAQEIGERASEGMVLGNLGDVVVLQSAHEQLQAQAGKFESEANRRAFSENVPWHREIFSAWQAINESNTDKDKVD